MCVDLSRLEKSAKRALTVVFSFFLLAFDFFLARLSAGQKMGMWGRSTYRSAADHSSMFFATIMDLETRDTIDRAFYDHRFSSFSHDGTPRPTT